MSARKLGRLAGFVFVLAAVLGGPAAASASVEHKAEVSASSTVSGTQLQLFDLIWG
jgi:hypothetical protein